MNDLNQKLQAFQKLLQIMDELREQCPWDKKQSPQSLRHLTIEETYELSEAILEGDSEEIKKELGDLCLHIVFYSRMASETGTFDIGDVLVSITDKLVRRHPHIYGNVKAETEEEVKKNWEQLKLQEGNRSVLSGVPGSLPALLKAYRMQEKAKGVGFEWETAAQVWEKVEEEMNELKVELEAPQPNLQKTEQELGDLLFSIVNYARFIGINPEDALENTNRKFLRRFQYIETRAEAAGKSLTSMTLAEMDLLWEEVKKQEKQTFTQ